MADLSNGRIAELLAVEASNAEGQLRMAFKRAARLAFLWPVEAKELVATGRSLKELPGIGPFLENRIREWLKNSPRVSRAPAERRDFLTMTEARKILARDKNWVRLYRGDLQMHSVWSDGSGTIRELAKAASERGYEYIGITDHSKGLKIAGGIDETELAEQGVEIERSNAELASKGERLRVLRSLEMNLNPNGEGDMGAAALNKLDIIIGSFHSALRKQNEQTARYLAALENPFVDILGHPRGRIYNFRLGLSADWARVFGRAAELDKALEIDSYPDRQDLNLELLEIAREEGARISINTDAHAPEQLGFVELGLAAALKARIARERIVNFMPRDKLIGWVKSLRVKAQAKRPR